MPIPPLPLERLVDGLRAAGVVPQPLYPAPSVSLISPGSSPLLLATPTAGRVGSLLGLNPYSSTSFLRSSSASFRCFRFRQKKRPASTSSATTAIGTTTATAILAAGASPPELVVVALEAGREAGPCDVDDDLGSVELLDVDAVGNTAGVWVDVSTTVVGCAATAVDPSVEADLVVREVLKITVGDCEVGGADVGGGDEEEDGGNVDGGELDVVEEIVVCIVVDGVLVDVIGGPDEVTTDVVVKPAGTDGGVTYRN